jgi:broad specificity phosphatase PhoE
LPSPLTTRVHLVRHGTTMLNRSNRYRGRIDVPLDQGGWQDAWTAAEALRHEPVVAIYASPLRRARDTARIIGDATGIDAVVDMPGLLNVDYGAWEGLTAEEAAERYPEAFEAYRVYSDGATCPDGESLDVAAERVLLSLRMVHLLHPGKTVAAVSHAVNVRLALSAITDHPRHLWRRDLPNGSVTAFDVTGDQIVLVSTPAEAGKLAVGA